MPAVTVRIRHPHLVQSFRRASNLASGVPGVRFIASRNMALLGSKVFKCSMSALATFSETETKYSANASNNATTSTAEIDATSAVIVHLRTKARALDPECRFSPWLAGSLPSQDR